jgi:beta-lactamase superfamily II metal-dependent hydrolase
MALISVGSVYMPKTTTNTIAFERLLDAIDAQGLKIKVPKAGSYLLGNSESDLNIRCLAPVGISYNGLNNYSIVLRICFGEFSVILTGDAEEKSEAEMVEKGYTLKSTVLKLGHHGSSSSSSAYF